MIAQNKIVKKYKKSKKRANHKRSASKKKKNVIIDNEFTLIKDVEPPKETKVTRVLPHWLLHPRWVHTNIKDEAKTPAEICSLLDGRLTKRLETNGIKKLFPVQQCVIPEILKDTCGMENRIRPRDICVATPTGSGKTLSYVLPVVQVLKGGTIPAIRALVILPVVELAMQVYKVFSTYAAVFELKVGQVYGALTFAAEQEILVQNTYAGNHSKVHIVIATPGRLMDHISETDGLDFSHLRFLILDEADKLMVGKIGEIIYRIQNHILKFKHSKINSGLFPFFPIRSKEASHFSSTFIAGSYSTQQKIRKIFSIDEQREDRLLSIFRKPFIKEVITLDDKDEEVEEFFHIPQPPLQRLLFSATLSSDPEELQNVSLYRPLLFTPGKGPFDMNRTKNVLKNTSTARPDELTEEYVETELSLKPLVLHYILKKERKKKKRDFKALVFTSSLELTYKIALLLQSLSDSKYSVREFSSKLMEERKMVLIGFLKGNINVLVSSDAMARGIDVPNVDCVVSYDVPSALTHVHRIGRTARAGNPGTAISIVTKPELSHLKGILGDAFDGVRERIIPPEKLDRFQASFASALENVSSAIKADKKRGKRVKKTLKRRKLQAKKARVKQ